MDTEGKHDYLTAPMVDRYVRYLNHSWGLPMLTAESIEVIMSLFTELRKFALNTENDCLVLNISADCVLIEDVGDYKEMKVYKEVKNACIAVSSTVIILKQHVICNL